MTQTEIVEELKKLSSKERLEIIEAAAHLLQKDLHQIEQSLTRPEMKRELAAAAKVLLPDYEEDA